MEVVGNGSFKKIPHRNITWKHIDEKLKKQKFQNGENLKELGFELKVIANVKMIGVLRDSSFEKPKP